MRHCNPCVCPFPSPLLRSYTHLAPFAISIYLGSYVPKIPNGPLAANLHVPCRFWLCVFFQIWAFLSILDAWHGAQQLFRLLNSSVPGLADHCRRKPKGHLVEIKAIKIISGRLHIQFRVHGDSHYC